MTNIQTSSSLFFFFLICVDVVVFLKYLGIARYLTAQKHISIVFNCLRASSEALDPGLKGNLKIKLLETCGNNYEKVNKQE